MANEESFRVLKIHPDAQLPRRAKEGDAVEEWRKVVGFEKYSVSSFGRILLQTGKITFGSTRTKGYLGVTLLDTEQKRHGKLVHRLVAEAFLGPAPTPNHYIDHFDDDEKNNKLSNLSWMTAAENNAKRIMDFSNISTRKPVHQMSLDGKIIAAWKSCRDAARMNKTSSAAISAAIKFKRQWKSTLWKYVDDVSIPDEQWKILNINNAQIVVSDKGRVKIDGRITTGTANGCGNRTVHLMGRTYFVHRLILLTFRPLPPCALLWGKLVCHHIDGDHNNNKLENLEWQFYRHAIFDAHSRVVEKIATDGTVTAYFSLTEAAKDTNTTVSGICVACKYGTNCAGCKWRYK